MDLIALQPKETAFPRLRELSFFSGDCFHPKSDKKDAIADGLPVLKDGFPAESDSLPAESDSLPAEAEKGYSIAELVDYIEDSVSLTQVEWHFRPYF